MLIAFTRIRLTGEVFVSVVDAFSNGDDFDEEDSYETPSDVCFLFTDVGLFEVMGWLFGR